MQARVALSNELSSVSNVESAQAQLYILMGSLQLCRSDNMGSRDVIPGLMICLQQDQECYDFLKCWATAGQDRSYDPDDLTAPSLNIKNANPL